MKLYGYRYDLVAWDHMELAGSGGWNVEGVTIAIRVCAELNTTSRVSVDLYHGRATAERSRRGAADGK